MRYGLVILSCLLACAPIDATHPLDPDTPTALQAPATILGSFRLPNRFDESLLPDIRIYLDPLQEGRPSFNASGREDGRFVIPDVTPGQYRFYCSGPGVRVEPVFVNAVAGAELDMGAVALEPIVGVIQGTAFTVFGEPAAGAVVSADDAFDSTITDTEGRFALRVFAGQRILAIALQDYYTWASAPIDMMEGGELTVEEPIFLLPINGTLQGSVRLRQYSTLARALGMQFELRPQVLEIEEGRFVRDNRVLRRDFALDETGLLSLENVIPGAYTLSVFATGYDTYRRPVVVKPNQITTLGLMELTHESIGASAVQLSGRLRSGLSGLTSVSVEISIDDPTERVPFARVLTDTSGRFSIFASSADFYHIYADVTGFRDVDKGPYRYDPERGFVDVEDEPPDINLSAVENE